MGTWRGFCWIGAWGEQRDRTAVLSVLKFKGDYRIVAFLVLPPPSHSQDMRNAFQFLPSPVRLVVQEFLRKERIDSHYNRAFFLEVGWKEVGIFLPLMVLPEKPPQRPPVRSESHGEPSWWGAFRCWVLERCPTELAESTEACCVPPIQYGSQWPARLYRVLEMWLVQPGNGIFNGKCFTLTEACGLAAAVLGRTVLESVDVRSPESTTLSLRGLREVASPF